jgi:hypothetical protein
MSVGGEAEHSALDSPERGTRRHMIVKTVIAELTKGDGQAQKSAERWRKEAADKG